MVVVGSCFFFFVEFLGVVFYVKFFFVKIGCLLGVILEFFFGV